MTIPVPLDRLAATLDAFGSALLVAPTADGWPRVFTVDPVLAGEELLVPNPSRSARRLASEGRPVTLAWQPRERHGWTLIVDGWADAEDAGLRIRIDHAILHRPDAHADGPAWVFPG